MLQEIKQYIAELPDEPFEDYYQRYVKESQDRAIRKDLKVASQSLTQLEDTVEIIKGLNKLTEELGRI